MSEASVGGSQTFTFNLNEMNVSTPVHKRVADAAPTPSSDLLNVSRKQLFLPEEKKLSPIMEETKSYASSCMSTSNTLAQQPDRLPAISEENSHNFNLETNAWPSCISSSGCVAVQPERLLAITEEQSSYNFNLEQNMKANAALRSSLFGGEFMDCETVTQVSIFGIEWNGY